VIESDSAHILYLMPFTNSRPTRAEGWFLLALPDILDVGVLDTPVVFSSNRIYLTMQTEGGPVLTLLHMIDVRVLDVTVLL
jgi:hypothetical protein